MRISLVIPTKQDNDHKAELLAQCVGSFSQYVDEIIIISEDIKNLAQKINMGLVKASGDFIIVANDDLTLVSGDLRDLCIENTVTSPLVNNMGKELSGHIWCIPKNILTIVGYMYQGYEVAYYDDDDYFRKIAEHDIAVKRVQSVNVSHPIGGTTLLAIPGIWDAEAKNKDKFNKVCLFN